MDQQTFVKKTDRLSSARGETLLLKVDPQTGAAIVFASIGTPTGGHGINGLTFDPAGNVYVSDSFAGTIWEDPPRRRYAQCLGQRLNTRHVGCSSIRR